MMFCWSIPTSSGTSTPKLHLTEYTAPVNDAYQSLDNVEDIIKTQYLPDL